MSNGFIDIHVFRFDALIREIYILAGEDMEIIVPPNGLWRFLNETEL